MSSMKHLQSQTSKTVFIWVSQNMLQSHPCQRECVIFSLHSFAYLLPEWAVSSSGGLWHYCDIFCCCFSHKASCFSVVAGLNNKKQNALPSFPLNQRDVESQSHGWSSQFTGSVFICKHWGWKECRAAGDKVVKQTHACLSLRIQEVELAHSSRLLLSEWVCAIYLSVAWFPLSCRLTQDWFVVRMDTSLTPTSPNQPLESRDFFKTSSLHDADSS